jgi:hypothetical protein
MVINLEEQEEDIITFKDEAVIILDEEHLWDIISDPRYEPIFKALREGPMTVRDITERYNQIISEEIDKLELSSTLKKEKQEGLKRMEKTIYKYLNFLQKEKLIVKAGKRIKIDKDGKLTQTASENLYGRTAKLYLFTGGKIDIKDEPEFQIAVPILGKILSLSNKLPNPSEKCLSIILLDIYSHLQSERRRIFEDYSDELAEISKDASYEILSIVINSMDILNMILNGSKFRKELLECFKS